MAYSLARAKSLTLMAQMAALLAISSQIVVPLPFTPVPINLGTLAVMLTGALLGAKKGTAAVGVFLMIGAFGVPVFAGFRGGVSALAGPTGGYLIGYLAMAFIVGTVSARGIGTKGLVLGMILGTAACYALGTVWFVFLTGRTLAEAVMLCVVPFLVGDGVKIAAATLLSSRLSKYVK